MDTLILLAPVLIVAASLWLLLRLLHKTPRLRLRRAGSTTPLLAAADRVSLTAAHSLHLVRVGGEYLLLGAHSSGLTVLRTFDAEEAAAARSPSHRAAEPSGRVRTFAGVQ